MNFGAIERPTVMGGQVSNVTKAFQDTFYWIGRQIKDLWNATTEAIVRIWLKIVPYLIEGMQKVANFFRTGPGVAVGSAALGALLMTLSFSPAVEEVRWLKITMRVLSGVTFAGSITAIVASVFKGPTTRLL